MPNVFDKFMQAKTGINSFQVPPEQTGSTGRGMAPFRSAYNDIPINKQSGLNVGRIPEDAFGVRPNASGLQAQDKIKMMQVARNRNAIDPYAERAMFRDMVEQPDMRRYMQGTSPQTLENPIGDIIRSTHERPDGTMSMSSNYVKWWDKLPRGKALMSLFNPAGVVENAVMEDTLGMPVLDAIGAATGFMSPEDKARYEQMYYEQTGT